MFKHNCVFNFILDDVTYVDFVRGVVGSCGAEGTPCKYLRHGVQVVNPNGKVVIVGEQKLSATIYIKKNVSIECMFGRTNAVISNNGNIRFAFKVVSVATVTISCITFKNVSVISMYEGSSAIIKNCQRYKNLSKLNRDGETRGSPASFRQYCPFSSPEN